MVLVPVVAGAESEPEVGPMFDQMYVFPRGESWMVETIGERYTEAYTSWLGFEWSGKGMVCPTPFGVTCPVERVLSELQELNDGVYVDWCESEAAWAAS